MRSGDIIRYYLHFRKVPIARDAAIPVPKARYLYITHPCATNCPLSYPIRQSVRLACLSHAVSVRSEPGSNSSIVYRLPDGDRSRAPAGNRLGSTLTSVHENVDARKDSERDTPYRAGWSDSMDQATPGIFTVPDAAHILVALATVHLSKSVRSNFDRQART